MRLALALLAVAAAPRHTPSTCAIAWNAGATAEQHAVVARAHAHTAFIEPRSVVGTDTWSKAGATTSTSAPGCSIRFVVPAGGTIAAWGAWSRDLIPHWHILRNARAFPVPHNARVHADGSVGFTG